MVYLSLTTLPIRSYFISFSIECYQIVLGTRVGRTKHMRIMPGGALEQEAESGGSGGTRSTSAGGSSSIFVGDKLDEHRGAFLLEHPMDHGAVVDTPNGWDAMERLWEVRMYDHLLLEITSKAPYWSNTTT